MILALRRYVCDVKRPVGPHARDLALVVFRAPSIFRLDPVTDAHARAAPVAVVAFPFVVARAFLGFDIFFEDAHLFFAVIICVGKKSLDGGASRRRHSVEQKMS